MEACDRGELVEDADQHVAPPNGAVNELLNVGQDDNMQGQVCLCKRPCNSGMSNSQVFLVRNNTPFHECDKKFTTNLLSNSCITSFLFLSSDGGVSGPSGRVQ